MKTDQQALIEMKAIRTEIGYSRWRYLAKQMERERLQIEGRPERIKFPPSMYQKLFDDQKGICPECQSLLDFPAKRNEIDHKNPNEPRFNERFNLQLLHKSCNREKSAMTIQEQSKAGKGTFTKILRVADEQEI